MRAWAKTSRVKSASLHTAYPTLGNELAGSGYGRAKVLGGVYAWDLPVDWKNVSSYIRDNNFYVRNKYPLVFPEATANWSAVTHIGLWGDTSDLPGGSVNSLIMTSVLDAPLTVVSNYVTTIETVEVFLEVG